MRPFDDARRSGVRFAAECLAFANVPSDETLEELLPGDQSPPHHPAWKARVPRDNGPGWDFDDVRDHYVGELFDVDPSQVRYADRARYLAMGRVATGEAMARTYGEWRRGGSVCRGALIWFYRDLWPGAGWGVVDAHGRPKSAFYYLKRALSPVALFALDEGLNGVELCAVNDGPEPIDGEIALLLLRDGITPIAEASAPMAVPGRGATNLRVDAILPHFLDTTYAYRFGPPGCDAIVARLRQRVTGVRLAETFYFPLGFARPMEDVGLEATASPSALGSFTVTLRTRKLAQAVALDVRGFVADDDHFHLAPGDERVLTLRPNGRPQRFEGMAKALNAPTPVRIRTNTTGPS
jgi:beta-mannosidase